jgi:DsbE subfamily thiol:disulfide oxidoreductase
VYRNDAYLVTLRPRLNQYAGSDQNVTIPALHSGLREDLYLVLAGWGSDGATATLKVFVNPLANFLWLGGLIFLGGGVVAAWSDARGKAVAVSAGRRRTIRSAIGLAIGVVILGAAGVAMWGPGHGAVVQAAGRPLPGQAAPDFRLTLLDGTTLQLADLRGEVAVLNFWASWCPPCEDEMPDLQAVSQEYEGRGATFVGIAFQDEEEPARNMLQRFGVTYPVGMDVDSRISGAYGVTGPPETFIVDQEGRVARVFIGPVTAARLREELNGLLEGQ